MVHIGFEFRGSWVFELKLFTCSWSTCACQKLESMVIYILYTPLVREHVYSGTYIIVDIEDSYVVTLKTGHIY